MIYGVLSTYSQVDFNGFDYYDEHSTELIAAIRQQRKDEIKSIDSIYNSSYRSIYRQTTNQIVFQVESELFIKDELLENWLHGIHDQLIETNPSIRPARKLLIRRDGTVNAISYIEGTIIINLGLIAKLSSEGEMAFTLAHELAHYHLNHIRTKVDQFISRSSSKDVIDRIKKIPQGEITLEDLEYVQTWFSLMYRNSRHQELDADSLAVEMIKNAGYSSDVAVSALENLKNIFEPFDPLNRQLFDEFIFDELPFKKRWLKPYVFSNRDNYGSGFIDRDSTQTHPNLELRKERIPKFSAPPIKPNDGFSQINTRSKFELINSFYIIRRFDFALHTALQLKKTYGEDSYLNYWIGRILHDIALAKNDKILHHFVSPFSSNYPNETRALNNFLHNLTVAEASEIVYLYINKHFDEDNPSHFVNLYNTVLLTNRIQESRALKKRFKKKFPKKNINKLPEN